MHLNHEGFTFKIQIWYEAPVQYVADEGKGKKIMDQLVRELSYYVEVGSQLYVRAHGLLLHIPKIEYLKSCYT